MPTLAPKRERVEPPNRKDWGKLRPGLPELEGEVPTSDAQLNYERPVARVGPTGTVLLFYVLDLTESGYAGPGIPPADEKDSSVAGRAHPGRARWGGSRMSYCGPAVIVQPGVPHSLLDGAHLGFYSQVGPALFCFSFVYELGRDMAARSASGSCCVDPVPRFPRMALRSRSMKPTQRVIRPRNGEREL